MTLSSRSWISVLRERTKIWEPCSWSSARRRLRSARAWAARRRTKKVFCERFSSGRTIRTRAIPESSLKKTWRIYGNGNGNTSGGEKSDAAIRFDRERVERIFPCARDLDLSRKSGRDRAQLPGARNLSDHREGQPERHSRRALRPLEYSGRELRSQDLAHSEARDLEARGPRHGDGD